MATSRQVKSALAKFTKSMKKANKEIENLTTDIRDLEKALETWDADEDLDITRGIKREIDRGKDEIIELRKNVAKLEREISDTNRKYANLAR